MRKFFDRFGPSLMTGIVTAALTFGGFLISEGKRQAKLESLDTRVTELEVCSVNYLARLVVIEASYPTIGARMDDMSMRISELTGRIDGVITLLISDPR